MDRLRRAHARVPCELAVEIWTGPVGGVRLGPGLVLDVSLSGALLRASGTLRAGATYRLRYDGPDGTLELPGRVVREVGAPTAGARHYGLAFNLTGGQERTLRGFLDRLRRHPKHEPDDFLRDYWA